VEGKKFKLRNLPLTGLHDHFCCVWLRTWSTYRLSLQQVAVVLMPNIADLAHSGFSCWQPWFLRQSGHIFPGKNSWISIKISTRSVDIMSVAKWTSHFPLGANCLGFDSQRREKAVLKLTLKSYATCNTVFSRTKLNNHSLREHPNIKVPDSWGQEVPI